MTLLRAAAIANCPIAEEAAQGFLMAGGGAIGSVLCGFFAAAGAYSGVLLGPVTVIIGGVGVGARCFDGRLEQPGRGMKRPRGFQPGEEIPDAARIAVPNAVAAGLVAYAYSGQQRLGSIVKPGISKARQCGAEARASLLRRIREAGAGAFREADFVRAMLHVAGPGQGGLMTSSDFTTAGDIDRPVVERTIGGVRAMLPPWHDDAAPTGGIGYAICAIDAHGSFCGMVYRRPSASLTIDSLELEVPLAAVPVRRGVSRTPPGARLAAPAPLALIKDSSGALSEVVAAPGAPRLDDDLIGNPPMRLRRSSSGDRIDVVRR